MIQKSVDDAAELFQSAGLGQASWKAALDGLAAVTGSTGAVDLAWNPNPDKAIKDLMVSPDGTRVYLAGDFAALGNTAKTRLAAVAYG